MLSQTLRSMASANGMKISSGMAYGMVHGCYVTFSSSEEYQSISIYVGAQEAPAPGCAESVTVSCARQIIHTITAASGESNVYHLMTGHESIPAMVLNHAGSVVTVNFPNSDDASDGIGRFIHELLPQLSVLTRPQQCIYCGQLTNGEGVPVRLSADTAVPMHTSCQQQAAKQHQAAIPAAGSKGVWGAVLGALVGATIWMLMFRLGYFASIVCVLIGLLTSRGYDLMKGQPGRTKLITVAVCTLTAVLLGTLFGSLLPYLEKYAALGDVTRQMFADISGRMPVWFTYLRASIQSPGSTYWSTLGMNLLLSTLFAAIGCCDLFRRDPAAVQEAGRPRQLKGKV